MKLEFFLNFEPDIPKTTHQVGLRAGVLGNGKPYLYKDPQYMQVEAKYAAKLSAFAPPSRMTGPLELSTTWMFLGEEARYRTKKPDTDNLVKLLKDVMTDVGFWKDDSQVVRESIVKLDVPCDMKHGVKVSITQLEV